LESRVRSIVPAHARHMNPTYPFRRLLNASGNLLEHRGLLRSRRRPRDRYICGRRVMLRLVVHGGEG
jgi:hypothetical protein